VRLDPDYALPHGYMAAAYGQISRSALGEARESAKASSLSHARCAIALGANDSTALAYAAYMLGVVGQDMAGARLGLDRALALNPNSAMALMFRANVLALSGEALAAIADAEKAMRLSPLDTQSYLPQVAMAIAQVVLGENDAAASWARKAIRTNPRYPVSYVFLMVAECRRGNRTEAEAQLRQLEANIPDFGPKRLFALLNIYPPEIREALMATLRAAGFLAEG
jgi:adenylate cyclase